MVAGCWFMKDSSDRLVWINGSVSAARDATISAFDHAITVGDGLFETIEATGGQAFALGRHLARMRRSAAAMHIDPGYTDHELRVAIDDVLRATPTDGLIRLTVSAGDGPLGSGRYEGASTVIIATAPGKTWDATTDIVTVEWARNDLGALAGVKSTSYAENVLALRRASAVGATEAIFPNTRGNLCEGTGTNIFIEFEGRLVTPPLSAGCLAGVTRELLLEVIDVDEIDVPMAALHNTTEAFVTSTTRDVLAIAHVDGIALRSAPGPLTIAAAEAFAALKADHTDP